MIRQYRSKFYLNASHYIHTNDKRGETHSHCFEIIYEMLPIREKEIRFYVLEKDFEQMLEPYQGKVLNNIPPFDKVNPTVENICEVFINKMSPIALENDVLLISLQVSETPTRSYIINAFEQDLAAANELNEPIILPEQQPQQTVFQKAFENPPIATKTISNIKAEDRDYSIIAYLITTDIQKGYTRNEPGILKAGAKKCEETIRLGHSYWEYDI